LENKYNYKTCWKISCNLKSKKRDESRELQSTDTGSVEVILSDPLESSSSGMLYNETYCKFTSNFSKKYIISHTK
jgi:hypothetical protein